MKLSYKDKETKLSVNIAYDDIGNINASYLKILKAIGYSDKQIKESIKKLYV